MSRNGTLLPIPPGSQLAIDLDALRAAYPDFYETVFTYPRSAWLKVAEGRLRQDYPLASSADLRLTARHLSATPEPIFALRDGPNVP